MYEWKLFTPYTYTLWPTRQFPAMIEAIAEATGGALQIEIFIAGEHPYKHADMLKVVNDRDAEMSEVLGGYVAGVEPPLAVFDVPMIMPPDISLAMELYRALKEELVDSVLDTWNATEVLTYWWPHQRLHTKSAAVTANSLAGQKIRAWSKYLIPWVGLLGGIGVEVAWAEVPTALATGVVEGGITNSGAAYDAGWYDYVKYMNLWEMAFGAAFVTVNKDALAELDEATRTAFLATLDEWEDYLVEGTILDADAKVLLAAKDFGATIVAPAKDFRAEIVAASDAAIWQVWAADGGPKGAAALATIKGKLAELGY